MTDLIDKQRLFRTLTEAVYETFQSTTDRETRVEMQAQAISVVISTLGNLLLNIDPAARENALHGTQSMLEQMLQYTISTWQELDRLPTAEDKIH